jgi:autotransporter-associated beta strand protein
MNLFRFELLTIVGVAALVLANPGIAEAAPKWVRFNPVKTKKSPIVGTLGGTGVIASAGPSISAISAATSSGAALSKTGAGTLSLSGSNSFSGGVTPVSGGILGVTGTIGLAGDVFSALSLVGYNYIGHTVGTIIGSPFVPVTLGGSITTDADLTLGSGSSFLGVTGASMSTSGTTLVVNPGLSRQLIYSAEQPPVGSSFHNQSATGKQQC